MMTIATRPILALAVVGGILVLSFAGAAMVGHAGGCLASDLQRAACVQSSDIVQSAVFHSQTFISLFVLVPVALAIFLLIYKHRFSFASDSLWRLPLVRSLSFHLRLADVFSPPVKWRRLHFLSLLEHSPTV